MSKLTITFVYGKDEDRKLKYRLTGDMPIGVMIEKLISFQFIVDSADPKTFKVIKGGEEITDLTKTFDEEEIVDGDEIYLVPTVFEPIPPLPEVDVPVKKADSSINKPHGDRRNHRPRNNQRRRDNHSNHSSAERKGVVKEQGEKKEDGSAPIPFKPRSRNYHRNYRKQTPKPKA